MTHTPIAPRILLLGLPFFALALYAGGPAHASYDTQGALSVSAEGGSSISREIPFGAVVEISDSENTAGAAGNTAAAAYAASISGGSLQASASAQNALHSAGPPPDYWFANATASTALHDDLQFTIPAGSYPSGVYAVASVQVEGSFSAAGGAAASHAYNLLFGEGASDTAIWPNPAVSLNLDLQAELVAPGVTLGSPLVSAVPFIASVMVDTNAPGEVAQSSTSDISVQVISISVPAGVTWVSDSGVFCSTACAPAVPGLSPWAVATLAIALAGVSLSIIGRGHARRTDKRPYRA